MKKKFLATLLMAMALAVNSHAKLQGSDDFKPKEEAPSNWSALIGVSGGNSLIARDGTIFMNIRIGVALNPYISLGAFSSSILSNVQNPKVHHSQMIDYHAFGAFAEVTVFRNGIFSISLPVNIGGGEVDFMDKGDEDGFKSDDGLQNCSKFPLAAATGCLPESKLTISRTKTSAPRSAN